MEDFNEELNETAKQLLKSKKFLTKRVVEQEMYIASLMHKEMSFSRFVEVYTSAMDRLIYFNRIRDKAYGIKTR